MWKEVISQTVFAECGESSGRSITSDSFKKYSGFGQEKKKKPVKERYRRKMMEMQKKTNQHAWPNDFRFHFYSDEGNEPPHIHIAAPDG